MGAPDFLLQVRASGFTLGVSDNKLLVTPASRLTAELRASLRAHKDELVVLLAHDSLVAPVGDGGLLPDADGDQRRVAAEVTCAGCAHRLRHGTCGQPVEAGLAERFVIVWAPGGHGAVCVARRHTTPARAQARAQDRPHRLSQAEGDAAHRVEWDDDDCVRFEARSAANQRRGFAAEDAEDLAELMHLLDVQAEGRSMCLGCGHLHGSMASGCRCGNHTQAQVGRELPLALVIQPQRCPGFTTSR